MSTTAALPLSLGPDPAADARGYAAAVRAELRDLQPDVVEELTGGLEADLAELAAESSTPLAERLGDPRRYAAELRSAADLPAAPVSTRQSPKGFWARTAEGVREDRERVLARLREQRWWPGAVERAHVLRPAWWVARALVGWWLLVQVLHVGASGLVGLVLAVTAVWVSVELGRGRWARPWTQRAVVAGNVLAVVVLPFALSALAQPDTVYVDSGYVSNGPDTSTGVWVDGQRVSNIYPYDAQGDPLTGVQLLDDYGRPLATTTGGTEDWSGAEAQPFSPVVDVDGSVRWNAYPLRAQAEGSGAPTVPPLPEQTLPALVGAGPAVTPAATPSATATPTGEPTGSAAPTASDGATASVDAADPSPVDAAAAVPVP